MAKVIQPAFSRGEIAPDLFGRVDTTAYQLALKEARNVFIHTYGGASNRPGTIFVGPTKDHTKRARLLPFQFKTTDTHIIEVGDQYIRIIRNDAHVTETPVAVTGATQANPVEITAVGHGFTTGDDVRLNDIGGMIEVSGTIFRITNTGANTFTLQDQVSGTNVDGTGFTAFTSGGTAGKLFELVTPYLEAELRGIKFSQTADVMTLVHTNHNPRELKRLAIDNWTLTEIIFAPTQQPPGFVNVTARVAGAVETKYKVTATSAAGEESLPGISAAGSFVITGISNDNPATVTVSVSHGMDDGDEIIITGVVGMTEVNNRRFRITIFGLPANVFKLRDTDSTNFATYVSGGVVDRIFAFTSSGSANSENDISWQVVDNAIFYSVYRDDNGIFGFIGETESLQFEDDRTKITSDLSISPPQERDPFVGAGNFPGAVGQHQQRRVFGGSDNKPDTTFYSKIAATNNFTVAVPSRDSDAITATIPSSEVNQIRHYLSISDLLMFTSGSEWQIRGGTDAGFTAATITQKFQSNWGSADPAPLIIGSTAVFMVDPGIGVRTLGFNVQIGGFQSNDLSLLIPHLLRNRFMIEWDHARKPESLVYAVLDDGEMLVMSFEEEQEVIAWAHWDTAGTYESVAVIRPSITELTDAGYFVIKRFINGNTVRSIERTDGRQFEDVRDAFFVDNGLTFDNPFVIEDIDEADPVKITITGHPFLNGDEVDISDINWVPDVDSKFNSTQPDQLNDGRFEVANVTANDFTLKSIDTGLDIDGSAFNLYVDGGDVRLAVTTIFGFQHLANEPVVILADGNVVRNVTVSATGSVTLPRKFSRIHVGLPYVSDIETLNLERSTTTISTIQGALKKIARVTVKFARSRGLLIGPDSDNLTEMKQREFEKLGEPTELLTGDKRVNLVPSWNLEGRIFLRQKDPLPMTILALVPDVEIGDD